MIANIQRYAMRDIKLKPMAQQDKEQQAKLLSEIMQADEKDGLYKTNIMKQQTAVEWLVEQIKSDQNQKVLSASEWMKVIEKAKEIERNQRIQDYNVGYTDAQCNHINDAENYVNEINYINSKEK